MRSCNSPARRAFMPSPATARSAGRHTIVIGLSEQALRDGLGVGGTPEGQRLPAAALRRMACDANIIPAVYDGDSQIFDFGRSTRSTPAGLRRFIIARDGGCVFPGCDRPPSWTVRSTTATTGLTRRLKPNAEAPRDLCCTTITRSTKAAGPSPSATTTTAPPGSTHPTADHPSKANAGHCSAPPPRRHDAPRHRVKIPTSTPGYWTRGIPQHVRFPVLRTSFFCLYLRGRYQSKNDASEFCDPLPL